MFSLLAAASAMMAQSPTTLTEHIALASMFKNGYAVILREMSVSGSGEYLLEQIPAASLGTLWFTTSDGAKLTSVVNTEVPKVFEVPITSIGDILTLNIGKRFTLYFLGQEAVTGTLIGASGSTLRIKNGEITTVVDRGSVVRITSPDNLTDSSNVKSGVRGLRFQIESKGPAKIFRE